MAREKEYFRDVVAEIIEETGKKVLCVDDVRKYLKVGTNKAKEYFDGEKRITVFQLASKLL
jgi:hypothetical protein